MINEIINSFIRKNKYLKSIYYCEHCGRPIYKGEQFILLNQEILCNDCDNELFKDVMDNWIYFKKSGERTTNYLNNRRGMKA